MNTKKVRTLRGRMRALRQQGGVRSQDVESLAIALGRKLFSRGKEPTWVNENLPGARPLSIPHHNKDLRKGTKNNILDTLEADLDAYEEKIIAEIEKQNGHV